MNSMRMVPRKDYVANRLVSGVLQLASNTSLFLDETQLEQGQLDASGERRAGVAAGREGGREREGGSREGERGRGAAGREGERGGLWHWRHTRPKHRDTGISSHVSSATLSQESASAQPGWLILGYLIVLYLSAGRHFGNHSTHLCPPPDGHKGTTGVM